MPPLLRSAGVPSAMDQAGASSGGPDQARQQLEGVMQQIRDLEQQVEQLGTSVPALAPEIQQVRQILKRMKVRAGQQAPQQTASAQQLPG